MLADQTKTKSGNSLPAARRILPKP